MCTVSNVFPDFLNMKWSRKEMDGKECFPLSDCDKYKIPNTQQEKQRDGTFIYKSRLTFTPSVKNDLGAEFICEVDHPRLKKRKRKSTGPLQIKAFPEVKDICHPEDGIFTLEVDAFYPEKNTISWKLTLDSSKEEDITQNNSSVKSEMYENGSYRALSTCDLRKNDLIEGKSYSVTATVYHETLDSAIHRSFKMERGTSPLNQEKSQECPSPAMQGNISPSNPQTDHQKFIVNTIQGPQVWSNGEKVYLYLTASYCTKDVTVTWNITERDGSVWEIPDTATEQTSNTNRLSSGYEATRESTDKSDKEGLLDIVSCLTVVPSVSKHSAMTLSCKVICEGEVKEKQYTLQSIHAKPTFLDPVKLSLCDSGEVMYSINLLGFYPKDIDICWECGTDESLKRLQSQEQLQRNPDMTFKVQSECKVPGNSLKGQNFKVRVTWKHSSIDVMEFREMSSTNADFPWRPEIQEIPISHVINGREVTVQYNIYKYFPDALTVRWFRKERGGQELFPLSHSENLRMSDLTHNKQSDNTYTCTACLLFTPSLSSDQGAEFICRVEHPSLKQPIERGTGALVIMSKPNITGPLKLNICDPNSLTCTLNLTKLYPKDIQITWLYRSGQYSQELSSESVSEECADHTFNVTSTCTIPVHLFIDPTSNICVKWKHESMDKPESKVLSIKDPDFPWRPEIQEIPISHVINGREVTVQYNIYKYFPDALTVRWFRKERGGQELFPLSHSENLRMSDLTHKKQSENTYTCTACLLFTPSLSSDQGAELICRVEHPSLEQPIERGTGALVVMSKPNITGPLKLNICDPNSLTCTLNLTKLYPKDIQITWLYRSGQYSQELSSESVSECADHTFNVTSTCTIPVNLFIDPTSNICVKWKHESMDEPESKVLSIKDPDFPWRPEIQEIPISHVINGREVTVQYNIYKYFPDALTVRWFRKERGGQELFPLSHSENLRMSDLTHKKQSENTYTCTACLLFTPSLSSDQGAELICRVEHPSLEQPIERGTGALVVMSKPNITGPLKLNICDPNSLTCTLNLTKLYPKDIQITWLYRSGQYSQELSSESVSECADHTFNVTSTCTIPVNLFIDPTSNICVKWKHESMDEPESKVLSIKDPDFPWRPEIQEIPISHVINGREVTVQYNIYKYFPDALTVRWFRKERGGQELFPLSHSENLRMSDLTHKKQSENTYTCTACLLFTPSLSSDQGAEFICRVEHPSLEQPIERGTGALVVMSKPNITGPLKLNICDPNSLTCTLNLTKLYPKDIQITWLYRSGQYSLELSSESVSEECADHTFNVTSTCTIPVNLFIDPTSNICVKWKHESMDEPESKVLSIKDPDFPWRPEIQEIPISHVINGREVTVQFNISKYFPDALTVRWFRKERGGQELFPLSHSENLRMSDLSHNKQSDNTYTCTACLLFTPSLSSDQGAEFICRVEHPSLEQPIERGTGALVVMSKPNITGPLKLNTCDPNSLMCSLNLTKLYPKDIQITWLCRSGQYSPQLSSESVSEECADHTFNVTSTCTIPVYLFKDPTSNICVEWKHESMDKPESKVLSVKDPGFPWRPQIEDIVIPTLLPNVRLQCKISHYFPDVLTVTWFKRKKGQQERQLVPNEKYNIPDIQSVIQADQSYTCTAHVTYTPSVHAEQEAEFICKVDHPSLVRPITKCTGMLQLAKMTDLSLQKGKEKRKRDFNQTDQDNQVLETTDYNTLKKAKSESPQHHLQMGEIQTQVSVSTEDQDEMDTHDE
ncbi:uncharacterized protein LOC128642123 isoform X2 [Bombina bombina]|uniref:uncharacterized protein LOC128642123 isoform X2 n=1 Tax=Bombina bombina TaxID=8345 RepID=UPI00235ABA61|nr:uncharacterized protein LOC128642123 isoform X2 [Bombina bombina]